MMATGDEPQLGGQSQDNAPMISSIVTKVIADARGAYIVGNLQALWDRMNEGQQREFHRGLVRQALWYAEQILPPDTEHRVQRACLDAARAWLEYGSDESIAELHDVASQIEPADWENGYYQPLHDEVVDCIYDVTVGPPTAERALWSYPRSVARMTVEHVEHHPWASEGKKAADWIARRWQVEAAWAILNGKALPPIHHTPADISRHAYQRGQILPLIELMDEEQKLMLKRAIIEYTMWQLAKTFPPNQEHLEVVQQWLQASTSEEAAVAEVLCEAMRNRQTPKWVFKQRPAMRAAPTLLKAVWAADREDWAALIEEATSAVWEARTGTHELTEWWHIEAAWAILQGKELPPIELDRNIDDNG